MLQKLQSKPTEKRDECNETVVPILCYILTHPNMSVIKEFADKLPAPERNINKGMLKMASQAIQNRKWA